MSGPILSSGQQAMMRAAAGSPEVVVKITSASRHSEGVRKAIDYIGRKGEVTVTSYADVDYEGAEWLAVAATRLIDSHPRIPTPEGAAPNERRETLNIALSMPADADRAQFRRASIAFATEAFDGYSWMLASHDDTEHVHAHAVVKMTAWDGKRMNPKKADLRQWRESFAARLREHGIEANATPRVIRGVTARSQSQALHELDERAIEDVQAGREISNDSLRERLGRIAAGRERSDEQRTKDALIDGKILATREKVLEQWDGLAAGLRASGDAVGAASVERYAQDLPDPLLTRTHLTAARLSRAMADRTAGDTEDANRAVQLSVPAAVPKRTDRPGRQGGRERGDDS